MRTTSHVHHGATTPEARPGGGPRDACDLPPTVVRLAEPEPPAALRWGGIALALLLAVLGGLALAH